MISYIGGKYRIGKWIGQYLPNNIKEYSEVFGGAFWVYLRNDFKPEKVYYNDFNRFMVNLFESARNPEKLLKEIIGNGTLDNPQSWNYIPQNNELFQKFLKEIIEYEKNGQKYDIPKEDLAIKYAYLLTQVFSGTGLKENTKMMDLKGKYKTKFEAFVKRLNEPNFKEKLKNITKTYNLDFEKFINEVDNENMVFYVDPPYYSTENYYSFHNFTKEDHLRLANCLKNIKGKFVLSYYEFPELLEWFPKDKYRWEEKEFAKAASAKKGKKQNKGKEIIIMNY